MGIFSFVCILDKKQKYEVFQLVRQSTYDYLLFFEFLSK